MRSAITSLLFFILHHISIAQQSQNIDISALQLLETALTPLSEKIIAGTTTAERMTADSIFTRTLVAALKTPHSFRYPFDSLLTISRMYAPDSSFRIFSWQIEINENLFRQHGAIQMRTDDGSLKLIPLIDKSSLMEKPEDTITDNKAWYGAVYYNIVMRAFEGRKIYTLLGYDENSIRSNRKIIEPLTFQEGKPVFGSRIFENTDKARFILEYKKNAGPKLNYDPEFDLIFLEHLISESGDSTKKWTLIGDGDYHAFQWLNGQWHFIDKYFNMRTPENQEPVPTPVSGNKLEFTDQKPPTKKVEKKSKN